MTHRIVSLPLVFATVLCLFSPARAQETGAEVCSEAKALRALRLVGGESQASENFDATFYGLDITLDLTAGTIVGAVDVRGSVVDSPLDLLVLDLSNDMVVARVLEPPFTASDELFFVHTNGVLSIALPAPAAVGSDVDVRIEYSGTPDANAFFFGEQDGATYAYTFSQPYGAREWWPCKDHPIDKADSVHVAITVPDSLAAGSNGKLWSVNPAGAGRTRYEWHSVYPIATYLVSIAAGEYVEYTDTYTRPPSLEAEFGALALPLLHYVYDDGTSSLPGAWDRTADAMEVLEGWFGPYPFPDEKYGHAEWTRSGAMEHQTLTSMGSIVRAVMVHELAHQWFGDEVTLRTWPHLWLNEGFSTYSEYLYWQARDAEAPGTAANILRGMILNATRAEGTLVLEDTTNVADMFSQTRVYNKGGAVLHMLRGIVGDGVFRTILRDYVASVDFGSVTTADFQGVAESVSGLDLDTFFSQWVTQGYGYPQYSVTSRLKRSGDYKVFVTIDQLQGAGESNVEAFAMPVTIAVQTENGEERFNVVNDQRSQDYVLDVVGKPTSVEFDPDLWLLRDLEIEASSNTLATVPQFLTVLPNPLSASSEITVTLPDAAGATVNLYDVAGRLVREVARLAGGGPHEIDFDADGLASGVYFLRIDAPSGEAVRKITVVR